MTSHELDATTGLPALPGGYFWRVKRQKIEQIRQDYNHGPVDSTHVLEIRRQLFIFPFSRKVATTPIYRREFFHTESGYLHLLEETRAAWNGRGDTATVHMGGLVLYDNLVDGELIAATAQTLLSSWRANSAWEKEKKRVALERKAAEKAERQRTKKFEGTYPPKSV
jgi:hypothetical protein